ncbi:hypothetical protein OHJ21_31340 [Virgibacillus sp. LDC1]|uniref:hypothetical protein n=1 Tax=Paenibacillus lautus TaxID=1401 RepID=UPI002DBB40D0|nr:hypothetical protein [Paenibacillus lautus]MCV4235681.1 hypothetical protein [Virgibacillus sp. LDC1]MEC0259533.1 hypothetical protein [Paenibacillus lautus]
MIQPTFIYVVTELGTLYIVLRRISIAAVMVKINKRPINGRIPDISGNTTLTTDACKGSAYTG